MPNLQHIKTVFKNHINIYSCKIQFPVVSCNLKFKTNYQLRIFSNYDYMCKFMVETSLAPITNLFFFFMESISLTIKSTNI
jgi:hypothetical protein